MAPIEGDEGHAEARHGTEQLVDNNVFGNNPAYPVRVGEGGEDVSREEVPRERGNETPQEESLTGDTSASSHTCILLRMKGVEQRAGDKISGPDHRRRLYQETASNTADREANLMG